jgi:hypothetical protein
MGATGLAGQLMKNRQRKRRRLARARLRRGEHVAASKDFGNGPRLDRRGLGVALFGDRAKQAVGEAERGKRH